MTAHSKNEGKKLSSKTSARLHAVQSIYQQEFSGISAENLIREFQDHRFDQSVDDILLKTPDEPLFISIVRGVLDKKEDCQDVLQAHLTKKSDDKTAQLELLLNAILLCGIFEMMNHHDIDPPVIIADYLEITASYYNESETKLVNAVLDQVKKTLNR